MPRCKALVINAEKGKKKVFNDLNSERRSKDKARCGKLKAINLLSDSTFRTVRERALQKQLYNCDQYNPDDEELQHYPLASRSAYICRVDNQYKGILQWQPYELVSLDEITYLDWRPAGPRQIGLEFVNRENTKINSEKETSVRRIEKKFRRKLYMCAFCLESSTWPSKSSIEMHMIKCPERTSAVKEPINITRQFWTKLWDARRIYNPHRYQSKEHREAVKKKAISARNKRCYQRRKERQRALVGAHQNDE